MYQSSIASEPKEVDVIIIGAGPAGLSTALHLLQIDPSWADRLLVLEKETHPRHKLCAGGVTRLGFEILEGLGIPMPLPLPQVFVDEAHLVYDSRVVRVCAQPEIVVFHREEFDTYLADQAKARGVVIHENEEVRFFAFSKQVITIKTDKTAYRAKVMVAADGANGIVRRFLARNQAKNRIARNLEILIPALEDIKSLCPNKAVFEFTPAQDNLQGYFWKFPSLVGGMATYNCGVYDARVARTRSRSHLPVILLDALRRYALNLEGMRLQAHPIHRFSPRLSLIHISEPTRPY